MYTHQNMPFGVSDEDDRLTLFPLRHPDLYELGKRAVASFWTAQEIDISKDGCDYTTLSSDEQTVLRSVLGFFSAADGIVMKNISMNFLNENVPMECTYFYAIQNASEAIHSETYSLLIDGIIPGELKDETFAAIKSIPAVRTKARWAQRYLNSDEPYCSKLLAFICVEALFFSSSFAIIFWFRRKNGILKGLASANDFIARDEALHVEFGLTVYKKLGEVDPQAVNIILGAVQHEIEFIDDIFPASGALGDLTTGDMKTHVKSIANYIAASIGCGLIFEAVKTPFEFMKRQHIDSKSNFFETRETNYKKFTPQCDLDTTSDF